MAIPSGIQRILREPATARWGALGRYLAAQVRRALPIGGPIEVEFRGSKLQDDRFEGAIALLHVLRDRYDLNNMAFLTAFLRGGHEKTRFFDVGANIGSYSLAASALDNVDVVAFEPSPVAFDKLRRNVMLNGRSARVRIYNVAVSEADGHVSMAISGSSSLNKVVASTGAADVRRVECRSLDSVCAELGFVPDLVKMDIEGHEVAALRGFAASIAGIGAIIIERGEREEVRRILIEHGFQGPLYYDAERKVLQDTGRYDDPIYVNSRFAEEISNRLRIAVPV